MLKIFFIEGKLGFFDQKYCKIEEFPPCTYPWHTPWPLARVRVSWGYRIPTPTLPSCTLTPDPWGFWNPWQSLLELLSIWVLSELVPSCSSTNLSCADSASDWAEWGNMLLLQIDIYLCLQCSHRLPFSVSAHSQCIMHLLANCSCLSLRFGPPNHSESEVEGRWVYHMNSDLCKWILYRKTIEHALNMVLIGLPHDSSACEQLDKTSPLASQDVT